MKTQIIDFYTVEDFRKSKQIFSERFWPNISKRWGHIWLMEREVSKVLFWVSEISEEQVKLLEMFYGAYSNIKFLFQNSDRKTWERYFNHILRVAYSLLYLSEKPTFRKILIAMFHDVIEDTDKTFLWLSETYWDEIAFWVHLISKAPCHHYISLNEDIAQFASIKNSSILNRKWTLSNAFRIKVKSNNELSEQEKSDYSIYLELSKKYKQARNEDFFSHMKYLDSFLRFASEEATRLEFRPNLPNNVIDIEWEKNKIVAENALDALEVKFFDRIDNLKTSEVYSDFSDENIEKTKRKIEETKKYFLVIAKDYDNLMNSKYGISTNFYEQLLFQVNYLEEFLNNLDLRFYVWLQRSKLLEIITNGYWDHTQNWDHVYSAIAWSMSPWIVL